MDIQAILKTRTERALFAQERINNSFIASLPTPENTTESMVMDVAAINSVWASDNSPIDALSAPTQLRALCPSCFYNIPRPQVAVICIDGNFSQRRLGTANGDRNLREFRDRRLFIDSPLSPERLEVLPLLNEADRWLFPKRSPPQLAQETSRLHPQRVYVASLSIQA